MLNIMKFECAKNTYESHFPKYFDYLSRHRRFCLAK